MREYFSKTNSEKQNLFKKNMGGVNFFVFTIEHTVNRFCIRVRELYFELFASFSEVNVEFGA